MIRPGQHAECGDRRPGCGARRLRRGVAAVAFVCALMVVQLLVVGSVVLGARDQDLSVLRLESTRAFYAAESGMNMAMREVYNNMDYDADGGIGTVSNDSNAANDPAIGAGDARVTVTQTVGSSQTVIASSGRCGSARRFAQAVLE